MCIIWYESYMEAWSVIKKISQLVFGLFSPSTNIWTPTTSPTELSLRYVLWKGRGWGLWGHLVSRARSPYEKLDTVWRQKGTAWVCGGVGNGGKNWTVWALTILEDGVIYCGHFCRSKIENQVWCIWFLRKTKCGLVAHSLSTCSSTCYNKITGFYVKSN